MKKNSPRIAALIARTLFMVMLVALPLSADSVLQVPSYSLTGGCSGCTGYNGEPTMGGGPFSQTCTFNDPVPAGSRILQVRIARPAGLSNPYPWAGTPVLTVTLNGTQVGYPRVPPTGFCYNGTLSTVLWQSERTEAGFPNYKYGAINTVTFSGAGGSAELGSPVTIELVYQPPPPIQLFPSPDLPEEQRRLLLSIREGDPARYSSGLQSRPATMLVGGKTLDASSKPRSMKMHVRVVDPKDPSRYRTSAKVGDNDGRLVLTSADGSPLVDLGGGVYEVTSNVYGNFSLYAKATATESAANPGPSAGDNFIIEAALPAEDGSPGFANCEATGCAATGEITVWKRVYIEKHKMFRRGSFLTGPVQMKLYPPKVKGQQTQKWLYHAPVDNIAPFSVGTTVRLLHAPPYDRSSSTFYFDDASVAAISTSGELVLADSTTLGTAYYGPDPTRSEPYYADAVGVVTGTADYFESDTRFAKSILGEMFIEVDEIDLPFADVPHFTPVDRTELGYFGPKWMKAINPDPNKVFPNEAAPSHIFLLGAGTVVGTLTNTCQPLPAFSVVRGVTTRAAGRNTSAVLVQNIETSSANRVLISCAGGFKFNTPWYGSGLDVMIDEVVAHEIAHQWRVNGGGEGHCPYGVKAHSSTSQNAGFCRMNEPAPTFNDLAVSGPEIGDGVVDFHYENDSNSEYMSIRRSADPIPR